MKDDKETDFGHSEMLKLFPPRIVTITQNISDLERYADKEGSEAAILDNFHVAIDLKPELEQSFSSGQGVVSLSENMTDEQILALIKCACNWSKGKSFKVIPPAV